MADVKVVSEVQYDLGNFAPNVSAAIVAALNITTVEAAEMIKDYAPRQSGELAESISVIPGVSTSDEFIAAIVSSSPYIYEVIYGNSRVISADEMMFHESKWENYDPTLGLAHPDSNGYFHFRQVNHTVQAHPFVNNAMNAFDFPTRYKLALKMLMEGKL